VSTPFTDMHSMSPHAEPRTRTRERAACLPRTPTTPITDSPGLSPRHPSNGQHAIPHTEATPAARTLPFRYPPGSACPVMHSHAPGHHPLDESPPRSRKANGVHRNYPAEGPRPVPPQRQGDPDHAGGDRTSAEQREQLPGWRVGNVDLRLPHAGLRDDLGLPLALVSQRSQADRPAAVQSAGAVHDLSVDPCLLPRADPAQRLHRQHVPPVVDPLVPVGPVHLALVHAAAEVVALPVGSGSGRLGAGPAGSATECNDLLGAGPGLSAVVRDWAPG